MRLSGLILLASLVLAGCAHQYESEYVTEEAPSYLAQAEIVILMHDHDLELRYQGSPESRIGESTNLTLPIGAVIREIAARVFRSCFAYGVVFTEELVPGMQYIVAIEPEIQNFSYRYERRVEQGLVEVSSTEEGLAAAPVGTITPQVQFELTVKTYDSAGRVVMEKDYPSGLVSGESYVVSYRPRERINATFHAALQDLLREVAEDIRPFLVGQCEMTDLQVPAVSRDE